MCVRVCAVDGTGQALEEAYQGLHRAKEYIRAIREQNSMLEAAKADGDAKIGAFQTPSFASAHAPRALDSSPCTPRLQGQAARIQQRKTPTTALVAPEGSHSHTNTHYPNTMPT